MIKFSLLRSLARGGERVGVAWYFNRDENGKKDGRHREFCHDRSWALLDAEVWESLRTLQDRSIGSIEKLGFWLGSTTFHREPVQIGGRRDRWFDGCVRALENCDIVFLDPDNGLGRRSRLHATIEEIGSFVRAGRTVLLIKFPRRVNHAEQVAAYHQNLTDDAGAESIETLRICVTIPTITKDGKARGVPRIRWFTIVNPSSVHSERIEGFAQRLSRIVGVRVDRETMSARTA